MTTLRYCRLFTLPVKINKVVAKNACSTFVQKVEGGERRAHLAPPRRTSTASHNFVSSITSCLKVNFNINYCDRLPYYFFLYYYFPDF